MSKSRQNAEPTEMAHLAVASLYHGIISFNFPRVKGAIQGLNEGGRIFAATVLSSVGTHEKNGPRESHLLTLIRLWSIRSSMNSQTRCLLGELLKLPLSKNNPDDEGFTPLMYAAIVPRVDLVKMLLAKGADPHRDKDGLTALDFARAQPRKYGDFTEVIQVLQAAMKKKKH